MIDARDVGLRELVLGTRSMQQRDPLATQNQHIIGDTIIHGAAVVAIAKI
jgi:hypothetical protein